MWTNPQNKVAQAFLWNVLQLSFHNFTAKLSKFAFRVTGWVLSHHFGAFQRIPWNFLISQYRKLFNSSWGNSYIHLLVIIISLHFTDGERKLWRSEKVDKYFSMIVVINQIFLKCSSNISSVPQEFIEHQEMCQSVFNMVFGRQYFY